MFNTALPRRMDQSQSSVGDKIVDKIVARHVTTLNGQAGKGKGTLTYFEGDLTHLYIVVRNLYPYSKGPESAWVSVNL